MQFWNHTPAAPLSRFVEKIWLFHSYATPHARERLLPTGTVELVVNLREDRITLYDRRNTRELRSFRGSVICGPHSEYFVIDTDQETDVIGAHFRPGGAFPFLPPPCGELHNAHVGLDDLWGRAAGELRGQLLAAATPAAKFRVFEAALLRQARRPLERHPAVAFALRHFHGGRPIGRVADVISQIGLSPRRFIELFTGEVGLTPKLFCRVRRFQRVLEQIHSSAELDWADVALGCGYYDQAHFIHDFRAFSGLRPSDYEARRTPHMNHVPTE